MISRYFKIILLLIFLSTTILVVFIQYNSIKNINEQIAGNQNLLSEFRMKSKLQLLVNEVLRIDNKVRSAVIRNKVDDPNLITEQVKQIRLSVQDLRQSLVTDTTRKLWEHLFLLSEEKIRRSNLILKTLSISGKQAAEDFINTQKGVRLTESITRVAKQLELARQVYLTELTRQIDNNSQHAKRLGFVMAAVAIAIVLMAFWFISNRLRRQQHLIEQLNESERLQREAARVKEHFIANMSHEIRTPMNAILGFVNLLQKQSLDKKSALYVDTILQSSEKLLTIINDVLDLSKIEAGMMRIEKSQFSFSELMDEVESMLKGSASQKNLRIVYHIDKKIPGCLTGDPVRITQVLVNLISNAIKFTERGTINVDATLLDVKDDSIMLGLQVKDAGIGIAPEQLEKIFDRFTQAEESTTRRYGGTGLGLSIVQQIITLLGGSISVESELDKGTSFYVQIPLETASAGEPNHFEAIDITGTEAKAKPLAVKILVVEDNPLNQMLMAHLLEAWNYKFQVVENGLMALEILAREKFSLALMDIQMPEMDGYTTTQKIRTELALDIPIIAMTAHAFEGEKEKCIAAGMNDYLAKPIREQELAEMIEKYAAPNFDEALVATTANENFTNAIDLAYLRDISGGSVNFEKDILKQFLLQAPEEIRQLENAFQNKNWSLVKAKAHMLKSTTSFLGLQPLLLNDLKGLEHIDAASMNDTLLKQSLENVLLVCNNAVHEARELLAEAEVVS